MEWWNRLSNTAKAVSAFLVSVTTAGGIAWAGYSHFMTDAEAAELHAQIVNDFESYQKQQYLADKNDRIDRHQREVNRIEYQLLSDELTPKQREYLVSKKAELRDLIRCIREDRC